MTKRARNRAIIEAIEPRLMLSRTIYVDVNSPAAVPDGTSWAGAYVNLQAALAVAVSGDEIHVANGTYKPTSGTDLTISFQLKNGVSLLGGYAGSGAADPDARDVTASPTILSGDIGVVGDNTDNSYHVVVGSGTDSTAVLDGFTIFGGYAGGGSSDFLYGGGMYNDTGSPTVVNCSFKSNLAWRGGGMYNSSSSSPTVTNCTFAGNTATSGGGMFDDNSSPTLTNCTFAGNTASGAGGGVSNFDSSPTLTNCIVWGSGISPISATNASTSMITYSDIQGGYAGAGNLNADPMFVRSPWAGLDGGFGTVDDDYGDLRLRAGSPSLNAGSNSAIPAGIATDLAGNPRIQDGRVDVGAYEGSFTAAAPKVIYVDASAIGTGNGTSWADAFTNLSMAILVATDGDTIHVADGTYKPAINTDRTLSFALRSGISLYGGYAGYGAANPNARNIAAFPTILSGDIGISGTNTDNSYQVVTAVGLGSGTVDGVTITLGYADGSWLDLIRGAGVYAEAASLTLNNCTFNSNTAYNGGGMYAAASSPTLTNCTFSGNTAGVIGGQSGGGMYNYSSSSTLINCCFTGNTITGTSTQLFGGGIFNVSSFSSTLTNCSFSGNAAVHGGGIYNNTASPLTLTNCTFSENTAFFGGGMENTGSLSLTNCTFSDNTASLKGGGVYNLSSSSTMLTNCKFITNSTSSSGGGMCNGSSASPTLTNCTFSGNTATSGGGMCNLNSASPTLTNCTFSGNAATNGGGMNNLNSASSTLANCIFWGNGSNPILPSTSAVTYSDIEGGYAGVGNLNIDPQFVDGAGPDGIYGTADDNRRLRATSPCLDAGNNAAVPAGLTTDFEGNARFVDIAGINDPGTIVDMGAYERPLALVASPGVFVTDGAQPGVKVTLNNVLSTASISTGDIVIHTILANGLLGGAVSATGWSYDVSTRSVTFNLPITLPDGNYRATLQLGSVSDTYGSSTTADQTFDVFSLAGDANHDRAVNISDLQALASNWSGSGRVFSQGDFNYDGVVNAVDLGILSSHWQQTLTPPQPPPLTPSILIAPPKRTAVRVISVVG